MADKKITAEDLEGWYAPQQVRELAEKSGLSEQAAMRCDSLVGAKPRQQNHSKEGPCRNRLNHWPGITDDSRYDFWTGRLQIRYLEDTIRRKFCEVDSTFSELQNSPTHGYRWRGLTRSY
jgi:hypothetical protein